MKNQYATIFFDVLGAPCYIDFPLQLKLWMSNNNMTETLKTDRFAIFCHFLDKKDPFSTAEEIYYFILKQECHACG